MAEEEGEEEEGYELAVLELSEVVVSMVKE